MMYHQATTNDYEQLIQLWKKSVLATHQFLKPADMVSIEAEIRYWLPKMNSLIWSHSDKQIGFSACNENKIEMLFIEVDVNEQNEAAVQFYLKNGFQLSSRDELDNEGRAYPILHLELMK